MTVLLATFGIVISLTALATFVAARAWDYPPARLFVLAVATLVVMNMASQFRSNTADPQLAYASLTVVVVSLGFFQLVLVLLLSRLFAPEWWSGRPWIGYIALPYAVATVGLALDLVERLGVLVAGIHVAGGIYRLTLVLPGSILLLILFAVGWLVHLAILLRGFLREARTRVPIGMLAGAIVSSVVIGSFLVQFTPLGELVNILLTVPIIAALGYIVLRTRLLIPVRAALDLAIEAMGEAVVVVQLDGSVAHANPSAQALGIVPGEPLARALGNGGASPEAVNRLTASLNPTSRHASQTLVFAGRQVVFSRTLVADNRDSVVGALLIGHDVTEQEQRTMQLMHERARLQQLVFQLEAEQRERNRLADTVRALSLPVLPVLPRVLVLPLIGAFDQQRIDEFVAVLLKSVEREQARLVLIDITGLPLLDAAGANGLLQGVQAAALLGARCMLVGVRPEVAQALVGVGVSLSSIATAATLQQGLQREIRRIAQAAPRPTR